LDGIPPSPRLRANPRDFATSLSSPTVDTGKHLGRLSACAKAGEYRTANSKGGVHPRSNDLERERGITILGEEQVSQFPIARIKINLIDTGHADFGGASRRVVENGRRVFGACDAPEGPMPQTRLRCSKKPCRRAAQNRLSSQQKVDRPDGLTAMRSTSTRAHRMLAGSRWEEQLGRRRAFVFYRAKTRFFATTDHTVANGQTCLPLLTPRRSSARTAIDPTPISKWIGKDGWTGA